MSLEVRNTVIPARGIVAVGEDHLPPPDFHVFNPADSSTYDPGWYLFHTSRENLPSLDKDGGESTTLGSWWVSSIDTTYEDETNSIAFNSLEVNGRTLQAAWPNGRVTANGGWAVPAAVASERKAVFVFALSSSGRLMAWYAPNVDLRVGDMPEFDMEQYFEVNLSGNMLGAAEDVTVVGGTEAEARIGEKFVTYPPTKLVATP